MLWIMIETYLYNWRKNLDLVTLLSNDEPNIPHSNASAASKGSTELYKSNICEQLVGEMEQIKRNSKIDEGKAAKFVRERENLKNHNSSNYPDGPCNKMRNSYVNQSLFCQDKFANNPEAQPSSS